jgi:predicted DNA binding CopG/RHH family protein
MKFSRKQLSLVAKPPSIIQVSKMKKLDQEEQEILDAFESGKLKKSKNTKEQLEQHRLVAETTFKKDARINIRLSSRDLWSLQARALREGIPYQTLVSSVLHKFVDGQLIDKAPNK